MQFTRGKNNFWMEQAKYSIPGATGRSQTIIACYILAIFHFFSLVCFQYYIRGLFVYISEQAMSCILCENVNLRTVLEIWELDETEIFQFE
jgi:hypothetical protein